MENRIEAETYTDAPVWLRDVLLEMQGYDVDDLEGGESTTGLPLGFL